MKQWYYYKTIALFTLFDTRLGKVQPIILTFDQAKNIVYFRVCLSLFLLLWASKTGAFMAKGHHRHLGEAVEDPPLLISKS